MTFAEFKRQVLSDHMTNPPVIPPPLALHVNLYDIVFLKLLIEVTTFFRCILLEKCERHESDAHILLWRLSLQFKEKELSGLSLPRFLKTSRKIREREKLL